MKMQRIRMTMAVGKHKGKEMYTVKPMVFPAISTDRLAEDITSATTFTPADVEAVLGTFAQVVGEKLASGHPVDMGVIGTMRPTIKALSQKSAKDCTARTIKARGVRYSPRIELAEAMRNISMTVEQIDN